MFVLYFLLWIVYNGKFTLEIGIFGLIIAGVLFAFSCKFMDYSVQKELSNYKKIFQLIGYVFLLVWEILKANMGVIHMILTEEEEIAPVLVSFRTDLKTTTGKAFLANAITLTPGTITVLLEDNKFTVHCLDESMAEGLDDSPFAERLKKMEK